MENLKETVLFRNYAEEQHIEEKYKHGFIKAYKLTWEECIPKKDKEDKWNKKSMVICSLDRPKILLNLGECNDGSPFTSVNQAVNVAKGLCNYDDERKIESDLRDLGFKNEDFFKYNSLKDLDRIKIKEDLLEVNKSVYILE